MLHGRSSSTQPALGLVAALALSRYVSSFLFGVSATDLAAFVTVPMVLLTVALIACVVTTTGPAYRARLPSEAGGARHGAEMGIAIG